MKLFFTKLEVEECREDVKQHIFVRHQYPGDVLLSRKDPTNNLRLFSMSFGHTAQKQYSIDSCS